MSEKNEIPWYENHSELAYLADAMAMDGSDMAEIIRMLHKPAKYTKEYEYATTHGGSLEGFEQ